MGRDRKREGCRAISSDERSSSAPVEEIFTYLKEKWDAVENKSTVIMHGMAAIVALWLSSVVIDAIDSVPLLPKIMELVGLGYTGCFVHIYRVGLGYTGCFVHIYLLFESSRKELADDIKELERDCWKGRLGSDWFI